MNQILLDSAFLCCDCSIISDDSKTCPACAGGSLLALSRVLARESTVMDPTPLYRAVRALESALVQ